MMNLSNYGKEENDIESSEDFAMAYINCRTNGICYCYDIIE